MKTRHFRWVFLAALMPFVVLGFVGQPLSLGASAEWSDGNYRFAGGTEPWALAYSFLLIVLYLFMLFYSELGEQGLPLPGVFRRFIAFWLDFALAMMLFAPILGIVPTVTEWKRTGVFEWSFERTTYVPSDGLIVICGVLLTFVGLVSYYTWPLLCRIPSPGACIMGYQIVPDEGVTLTTRMALLRTLLGFVATAGWPIAPLVARDKGKGKFWLDKVFRTRAVKLK
jgi:hypothetical protein